jgi:hypothetical protein
MFAVRELNSFRSSVLQLQPLYTYIPYLLSKDWNENEIES